MHPQNTQCSCTQSASQALTRTQHAVRLSTYAARVGTRAGVPILIGAIHQGFLFGLAGSWRRLCLRPFGRFFERKPRCCPRHPGALSRDRTVGFLLLHVNAEHTKVNPFTLYRWSNEFHALYPRDNLHQYVKHRYLAACNRTVG